MESKMEKKCDYKPEKEKDFKKTSSQNLTDPKELAPCKNPTYSCKNARVRGREYCEQHLYLDPDTIDCIQLTKAYPSVSPKPPNKPKVKKSCCLIFCLEDSDDEKPKKEADCSEAESAQGHINKQTKAGDQSEELIEGFTILEIRRKEAQPGRIIIL